MFDGQHRRRAIRELLRDLHGDLPFHGSKWHDRLLQAAVPVMLYVEGNMEALRQMFADAARTRPVEKNAVTRFDERDPFNLAAKYLAHHSELFGGRVEMERAMVPRSSECIVAINQLANAVKAAELGISPKVAALRKSALLDVDDLCERGMEWADDFMPSARDEYNDLTAGNLDQAEIPELRKETLVFNATHIRVFAGCYFEWTRGHGSEDRGHWNALAESIRSSSFHVGDPHSVPVKTGLMPEGSSTPQWPTTGLASCGGLPRQPSRHGINRQLVRRGGHCMNLPPTRQRYSLELPAPQIQAGWSGCLLLCAGPRDTGRHVARKGGRFRDCGSQSQTYACPRPTHTRVPPGTVRLFAWLADAGRGTGCR